MQYLVLIYSDSSLEPQTPEGHAAFAKEYQELNASLAKAGVVRATATWPSGITTVRVREGKTMTTDGPFTEAREQLGGFMVVELDDLDAAIKIASRIPTAKVGSIEIRPMAPPRSA